MFNLKSYGDKSKVDLLESELQAFDITPQPDNTFRLQIGDEEVNLDSLDFCRQTISEGLQELKRHIWEEWHDLSNTAYLITQNEMGNQPSLDNLLFLNSAKKSYLLSQSFSELDEISDTLRLVFDSDAANICPKLIQKFNAIYLKIRLLHRLIMREIYRIKLIITAMKMSKEAQVSGPWANLDLPMKERIWEWSEDEEYFENRQRARREQIRYNPETIKEGFYYVWQDLTRDPYLFEDIKKDSPYKSRHLITIP